MLMMRFEFCLLDLHLCQWRKRSKFFEIKKRLSLNDQPPPPLFPRSAETSTSPRTLMSPPEEAIEASRSGTREAAAREIAETTLPPEFSTAAVPSQAARQSERERTFRDPAKEMPVIDWYLFYNDLVPETMDAFCRAAKEACDRRKVVGAYYCYMFEFGGDPEWRKLSSTPGYTDPEIVSNINNVLLRPASYSQI